MARRAAETELVAVADELGILLAGPNGQGVVSPPSKLCAQIVAPYPPAGHIGVASQSGNFVSSFMNYAEHSGIGISRAVARATPPPSRCPTTSASTPTTPRPVQPRLPRGDQRATGAYNERLRSVAENASPS